MTPDMADDVAALRQAFHRLAEGRRASDGCLDADWIWAALAGERPASEVRSGVLHLAECGECAEVWRVGRELAIASGVDLAASAALTPARPAWRSPWVWMPALAASLVLVVGLAVERRPWTRVVPETGTTLREGPEAVLTLGVPDGAALPREAFVLRWEAPAGISHYSVRVTTVALDVVAGASSLLEPTYQVPASALDRFEPGTRLLWQVDAFGSDRTRLQSPVFVVVVR